ncbi:MAG: signal recognition particle-docking protein FtsY [Acidobacteria bacterium]|nr:signal recognition particle-docking protein FtsY [Acidobacteriota bacterium]
MGILDRFKNGLARTRDGIAQRLSGLFAPGAATADAAATGALEGLEETLLAADVGVKAAGEISAGVRRRLRESRSFDLESLRRALADEIRALEVPAPATTEAAPKPRVVFLIGVNGGGKTTTTAKLAHIYASRGEKGLIAAADTFRAAAIGQIEAWARRVGVDLVRHADGADPGAVVFDALRAAKARGSDFVIVDTAGRLHTRAPLMKELEKLFRIAAREVEGAPHESLLVVDATTGQNGLIQAREFLKAGRITGLVLTKLDGTARGGIAIGIGRSLGIPLKYVGVGEAMEDLLPFSIDDYLAGILGLSDDAPSGAGGAPPGPR